MGEKETYVVAKLHRGYNYFYAYNPRFAYIPTKDKDAQCFQSSDENQLSFIVFDSFGYLREILYYGREWDPEWIQCTNLINIHSAFLSNVQNHFSNNEFINICQLLNKPEYQIMCDDRFKHWMQTVCKNNKSNSMDKNKMKNDIKAL